MARLLSGQELCEKKSYTLKLLAGLCHRGKIEAYRSPEYETPFLRSCDCNTKFITPSNTVFQIRTKPLELIAIAEKNLKDFYVYAERKIPDKLPESNNDDFLRRCRQQSEAMTKKRLEGICQIKFQYNSENYVLFCHKNLGSRYHFIYVDEDYSNKVFLKNKEELVWVYPASQIFFETKEKGEFEIKFLNIYLLSENIEEIKGDITKICKNTKGLIRNHEDVFSRTERLHIIDIDKIEKANNIHQEIIKVSVDVKKDSTDNMIYILSEFDLSEIEIAAALKNKLHIKFSEHFRNREKTLQKNSELWYEYKKYLQWAVNYYKKNDTEYSNPLEIEKDFFIFDYDEYRTSFLFHNPDEEFRTAFNKFICNTLFYIERYEKEYGINNNVQLFDLINSNPISYLSRLYAKFIEKNKIEDDDREALEIYRDYIDSDGKRIYEIARKYGREGNKAKKSHQNADREYANRKIRSAIKFLKWKKIPYIEIGLIKEWQKCDSAKKEEIAKKISESIFSQLPNCDIVAFDDDMSLDD